MTPRIPEDFAPWLIDCRSFNLGDTIPPRDPNDDDGDEDEGEDEGEDEDEDEDDEEDEDDDDRSDEPPAVREPD